MKTPLKRFYLFALLLYVGFLTYIVRFHRTNTAMNWAHGIRHSGEENGVDVVAPYYVTPSSSRGAYVMPGGATNGEHGDAHGEENHGINGGHNTDGKPHHEGDATHGGTGPGVAGEEHRSISDDVSPDAQDAHKPGEPARQGAEEKANPHN